MLGSRSSCIYLPTRFLALMMSRCPIWEHQHSHNDPCADSDIPPTPNCKPSTFGRRKTALGRLSAGCSLAPALLKTLIQLIGNKPRAVHPENIYLGYDDIHLLDIRITLTPSSPSGCSVSYTSLPRYSAVYIA